MKDSRPASWMETLWHIRLLTHRDGMDSMTGAGCATSAKTSRSRRAMLRRVWLAPAIWMSTEFGAMSRNMDTCGFPVRLSRGGRRITPGIGSGLLPGDGLGWTMLRGDSRLSIMAAGSITKALGAGLRDLIGSALTTLLHWWPGLEARALVLDLISASALVVDLAGVR
jgi:hypothetical protein